MQSIICSLVRGDYGMEGLPGLEGLPGEKV